jgi:dTMP kinase
VFEYQDQLRGRMIVFDGPDGSGKSTQADLAEQWLVDSGLEVTHVREPGGTAAGERVRDILLDPCGEEMEPMTAMLLFSAARAELIRKVIRPALAAHHVVLCDRFVASTHAYQGTAGGVPHEDIESVTRMVVGRVKPALTVIYYVSPEVGRERLAKAGSASRFDMKPELYHAAVTGGYRNFVATLDPTACSVDAMMSVDVVAACTRGLIRRFCRQWADDTCSPPVGRSTMAGTNGEAHD